MGVSGVSTDSQRSSQQQALYFSKFGKYPKRSEENRRFPPISTALKRKVGFLSG
jgi:hypothetical protein